MVEKKINSALPIYGVGLTFLLYGTVFPMYQFTNFILAAVISALVYLLLAKVAPKRTVMVEKEVERVETGDKNLDMVIYEGRSQLKKMEQAARTIQDANLKTSVETLDIYGGKILDYVEQHPTDSPDIRPFLEYYLPTTLKLVTDYTELKRQGVEGDNIDKAVEKIEGAVGMIVEAFKKQLDNLYEHKALDIVTDVNVMKRLLKAEGLVDSDLDMGERQ